MILFSPAKINFGLHIKEKRADGYHNIESILYPIPLHDVVEFLPASEFSLNIHGIPIPGSIQENSIWKTYHLMKSCFGLPGLKVQLLKNIPPGSGLGGASSNASTFIQGINSYFKLGLSLKDRLDLSAQIGSDCPFFIRSRPALVTGRGNVLKEIPINLKGYFVHIIYAQQPISTAWAYAHVHLQERPFPGEELQHIKLSQWQNILFNDFESLVFSHFPALLLLKNELIKAGAIYASLSGSGSAVFGLFKHKPILQKGSANKQWCFSL